MKQLNAHGAPAIGTKMSHAIDPDDFRGRAETGHVVIDLRDHLAFCGGHMPDAIAVGAADIFAEASPMSEIICTDATNQLLEKHISGESDNHKLLFSLTICREWFRAAQPCS